MRAALITGPPHTNLLLSFRGAPFSARARRDSGPHSSRETLAEDCPPSSHTSTSHHLPAPLSLTVARLGAPVSSCVVALSSPVSIHSKTVASPCVGATHRLPCPLSFMHVHAFPGRSLVRTHSCQSIGRGRLRTASRRVTSHASGRLSICLYSSWPQAGRVWVAASPKLAPGHRQAVAAEEVCYVCYPDLCESHRSLETSRASSSLSVCVSRLAGVSRSC